MSRVGFRVLGCGQIMQKAALTILVLPQNHYLAVLQFRDLVQNLLKVAFPISADGLRKVINAVSLCIYD